MGQSLQGVTPSDIRHIHTAVICWPQYLQADVVISGRAMSIGLAFN